MGVEASTSHQRTVSHPDYAQSSVVTLSEDSVTSGSPDLTPSPSQISNGDSASPTIDKTETVDQSPGPANEDTGYYVTGQPRAGTSAKPQELMTESSSLPSEYSPQDEKFAEEYEFPRVSDGNQSLSSHIEVSGIIIRIDGLPPNITVDPTGNPSTKFPSGVTNTTSEETISLGPIEISSILHQIISTSTLQNERNKTLTYINSTSIEEKLISSYFHTNESFPPGVLPGNYNIIQSNDIYQDNDQISRQKASNFPSPLPPEVDRYSIYHGPLESSNPYAHWDSDSEEQEHEMELQRLQELSEEEAEQEELDIDKLSKNYIDDSFNEKIQPPPSPSPSAPTTGRSYLLLLAGNSTIVRLRQKDFAKYLKLNLAARLSLEYDDVRVNRVVLAPPQLLVNVSVVTPSEGAAAIDSEDALEEEAALDDAVLKEEEPLHMLAETNATLLELSGEEYHVVRLLSLRSHSPDKKLDEDDDEDSPAMATIISDKHSDIELVIYTTVGGACALVILATLFLTFGRYLRLTDIQWPWRRPKSMYTSWNIPATHLRHRRMGDEYPALTTAPPTVIYSGSFAARAAAAASANSWVDEYQTQPGAMLSDEVAPPGNPPMLGVKVPPGNPLYTDLEMGGGPGNVIMGHNAALYAETSSVQRQSPSKLHLYSCRPGSIVIPPAVPTSHHPIRRNLAENMPNKDTHPLDVRIKEDSRLGHDNPNYQT